METAGASSLIPEATISVGSGIDVCSPLMVAITTVFVESSRTRLDTRSPSNDCATCSTTVAPSQILMDPLSAAVTKKRPSPEISSFEIAPS